MLLDNKAGSDVVAEASSTKDTRVTKAMLFAAPLPSQPRGFNRRGSGCGTQFANTVVIAAGSTYQSCHDLIISYFSYVTFVAVVAVCPVLGFQDGVIFEN